MKILVTGACGFIGTNFIHYELENHPDDEYVIIDKLTYASNIHNLDDIKETITFIKGDIADGDLIDELFLKYHFDIVINFAAETHVDRSIIDAKAFIKTNVEGVDTLLRACVKYGIKRFHQVSTDEVYGDTLIDSSHRFDEDSPLLPSNPYSASKASGDLLVMSYRRTFGLDTIITRSSNNYGPYQHLEKFIPTIIDRLYTGDKIPLYGSGINKRDWIYVYDNIRIIDYLMRHGESGIYNIATGKEYANLDIIDKIAKILGKNDPNIICVKDRKGHDLRYALDIQKISALGVLPKFDLEEGLRKTAAWYMAHPSFLARAKSDDYNDYLKKNYGE